MEHQPNCVEVWSETVTIPTYAVGAPDPNPMFLEKRVYQGSSGKVYPFPVIDRIYDEKRPKEYLALFLENDYLRIMILPELGGRIQRAYDKTNGYDFVYHNEVIKPALVGLTGPWISGGIEFNWPQHHRPSTFLPIDWTLAENEDGSKTVRVSETDRMYGTKGMASFTLYPDKAYLEIEGRLYNPTELPQTFLWWANPAVAVNDRTQSVFPPDVHAVMDHGKRGVSKFPIATGVYYKHDYGEGVDISRYKNIPVPTSYMCYRSEYDFVGGYDHGREAGILHVADHRVSPGKKQWTWGCGDFGKAWDRNLTDENGPYIELMTGVFTDNQPDFTWLAPYEEKTFTQYFMPYKKAGCVKNASKDLAMNLEVEAGHARLCIYATGEMPGATVYLTRNGETLYRQVCALSPNDVFQASVPLPACRPEELRLSVHDAKGTLLLSYASAAPEVQKLPDPASPARPPKEIMTNEELYLTGLHLEQYRHATFLPDDYYAEALARDPGDARVHNAYGCLLLRRGLFGEAEAHFRAAIERLTQRNPNPYDGEPYFNLGVALEALGRDAEAFDAFYKAAWSSAQQEGAFYRLACIAARRGALREALALAEKGLVKNSHNMRARGLKAHLLAELGRAEQAKAYAGQTLDIDPFDVVSGTVAETVLARSLLRKEETAAEAAALWADWGQYEKALDALALVENPGPMSAYREGYCLGKLGRDPGTKLAEAARRSPRCCFPNRLADIAVLRFAMGQNPQDAKAPYYLGNLLYDKRRYDEAGALWVRSAALDARFPTVWRNLALYHFNKKGEKQRALEALERAFALDEGDARVFLELDQLRKALGVRPEDRIAAYAARPALYPLRDDLCVEYATLLNQLGRHGEALDFLLERKFHPWEGGEGRVTGQYGIALTELAKRALHGNDPETARQLLRRALAYPENLGEGKLEGCMDNEIYHYLGRAEAALGNADEAGRCWRLATRGDTEPAGAMYYNDQPADRILYQGLACAALGDTAGARTRFHKLIDHGEKHLFDEVGIDYFAVSLPDLQLFERDLNGVNRAHCHFLIALGSFGMGDVPRARAELDQTLAIDPNHMGAILLRKALQTKQE